MKEHDFRWLQHKEGFRVMETDALPRPIKLKVHRPLAERVPGGRKIQGIIYKALDFWKAGDF